METEVVSKGETSAVLGKDEEAGDDFRSTESEVVVEERMSFFKDLVPLFMRVNSFFLDQPDLWGFAIRYIILTIAQLSFGVSIMVGFFVVNFDGEDIHGDRKVYSLAGVIVGCYILAMTAKPFKTGLMDWYRLSGGTNLGVAIVSKIFDLPLGAITTTPTGELTQVLVTCRPIIENVIPKLYGQVMPVIVETLFLVIFLSAAYGLTGLVILLLFLAYCGMAVVVALRKVDRSQKEMKDNFAMFGKLMNYLSSYERAHDFGNVGYTINEIRDTLSSFNNERYLDKIGELHEEVPLLIFTGFAHLLAVVLIPISTNGSPEQQLVITIYVVAFYLANLQEFATSYSMVSMI